MRSVLLLFYLFPKIFLDETKIEEYYPRVWGVVSASLHIVISLGQESIRYVKVKSHISLQRDQRNHNQDPSWNLIVLFAEGLCTVLPPEE
ncbi:hypothetical protein CWN88_12805 [Vibrio splendidus]|nr:hypothetical protein CWN88_12805 [Vibrio splendidus]